MDNRINRNRNRNFNIVEKWHKENNPQTPIEIEFEKWHGCGKDM